MRELEAKFEDLEGRLGNTVVKNSTKRFPNLDNYVEFVTNHVQGNMYAFFYDMVSLLQQGWCQIHVSVSKHWANLYACFLHLNKAVILAAMTTVLPSYLEEETGKKLEAAVPLTALPIPTHWVSSLEVSKEGNTILISAC